MTTSESTAGLRVGIYGSYGGMNLGDEAILQGILEELRSALPVREITIFSRNPEDTLARHAVDRALPVRDLTREESRAEIERLDLLILGGGGILFDGDVEAFLREVELAREAGVPVAVYAISAGPLKRRDSRDLVSEQLAGAALVSVRDRHALRLLQEVGVKREIHLTGDPALLLKPASVDLEMIAQEGLETDRPMVAFSVREPGPAAPDIDAEHYHALLAHTADFVIDRFGADVVFVPMERLNMDVQHSHGVIANMQHANHARVLRGEYTPQGIMGLLGSCTFAIGMRLHFLIFAALQGVPFIALPYASKVEGLIEDLGLQMPPLRQVGTGRLIAHLDRCWDNREQLRQQICARLPALQERARLTRRLLVESLAGHPALRGRGNDHAAP